MKELANPITATILALQSSDTMIATLGGTARVHGSELPASRVASMPEACIVVKAAGGGIGPGTSDTLPISVRRVDVFCYARTPLEASNVALAAVNTLKIWRRRTIQRHMVHWFNHASGPVSFRDPSGDWPCEIVTFQVQLADELTALA